jgi:hypothetical protein
MPSAASVPPPAPPCPSHVNLPPTPQVGRYISVPRSYATFVPGSIVAGIVRGMLDAAGFPARWGPGWMLCGPLALGRAAHPPSVCGLVQSSPRSCPLLTRPPQTPAHPSPLPPGCRPTWSSSPAAAAASAAAAAAVAAAGPAARPAPAPPSS